MPIANSHLGVVTSQLVVFYISTSKPSALTLVCFFYHQETCVILNMFFKANLYQ